MQDVLQEIHASCKVLQVLARNPRNLLGFGSSKGLPPLPLVSPVEHHIDQPGVDAISSQNRPNRTFTTIFAYSNFDPIPVYLRNKAKTRSQLIQSNIFWRFVNRLCFLNLFTFLSVTEESSCAVCVPFASCLSKQPSFSPSCFSG